MKPEGYYRSGLEMNSLTIHYIHIYISIAQMKHPSLTICDMLRSLTTTLSIPVLFQILCA